MSHGKTLFRDIVLSSKNGSVCVSCVAPSDNPSWPAAQGLRPLSGIDPGAAAWHAICLGAAWAAASSVNGKVARRDAEMSQALESLSDGRVVEIDISANGGSKGWPKVVEKFISELSNLAPTPPGAVPFEAFPNHHENTRNARAASRQIAESIWLSHHSQEPKTPPKATRSSV